MKERRRERLRMILVSVSARSPEGQKFWKPRDRWWHKFYRSANMAKTT